MVRVMMTIAILFDLPHINEKWAEGALFKWGVLSTHVPHIRVLLERTVLLGFGVMI